MTKPSSPYRPPQPRAQDPMYIYDEFVQQHRRLVSKLDLEERRRREAREKGEEGAWDPPQASEPQWGQPGGGSPVMLSAQPAGIRCKCSRKPNQSSLVNPPL